MPKYFAQRDVQKKYKKINWKSTINNVLKIAKNVKNANTANR